MQVGLLEIILYTGPDVLLESKEEMMLAISSLSVGFRNIELPFSCAIQCEKCLYVYFMLFFFVLSAIDAKQYQRD